MKLAITVFVALALSAMPALSQTTQDIDDIIEKITEDSPDDSREYLVNELYHLYENPININTNRVEELYILSVPEHIIAEIRKYRKSYGDFHSVFELKVVKGITIPLLKRIYPFIYAKPLDTERLSETHCRHSILMRSQRTFKSPAIPNKYKGDPYKHLIKYRLQRGQILDMGFTAEKDPGEGFFDSSQPYGFDFYSAYLQIKTNGKIKQINLGDYKTNWGEGLLSMNGFTVSKSSDCIKRANSSVSLKKYSSANENIFFRGISCVYSPYTDIEITPFVSYRKRDAKITRLPIPCTKPAMKFTSDNNNATGKNSVSNSEHNSCYNLNHLFDYNSDSNYKSSSNYYTGYTAYSFSSPDSDSDSSPDSDSPSDSVTVASFSDTGYHRTTNEINKKDKATEWDYGCRISLNKPSYFIALNYTANIFSPQLKQATGYWQTFNINGNKHQNISINYKFLVGKIYFFGESAVSGNQAFAHLCGCNFYLNSYTESSVIYRHYERDYQAMYQSAFGEFSDARNEEGLYIGIQSTPNEKLKLNSYIDFFRFTYPRYGISNPGKGYEYLLNGEYLLSEKIKLAGRFKIEEKPKNIKINKEDFTAYNAKSSFRLQCHYIPRETIELRLRTELSRYKHAHIKDCGYLLYHDLIVCSPSQKHKAQLRLCYFNTDSYNSRIYAYENEPLYSFCTTALFYEGFKTYLNSKFTLFHNTTLYIKYAYTRFLDNKNSDSDKHHQSDLKLQLRIKI